MSTELSNSTTTDVSPIKGEIKYVKLVGIWNYKVLNNTCDLCSNTLTTKCATCMTSKCTYAKECPISMGKCGHTFHFHCIEEWQRKASNTCPTDHGPWNFSEENIDKQNWKKLMTDKQKAPTFVKRVTPGTTTIPTTKA